MSFFLFLYLGVDSHIRVFNWINDSGWFLHGFWEYHLFCREIVMLSLLSDGFGGFKPVGNGFYDFMDFGFGVSFERSKTDFEGKFYCSGRRRTRTGCVVRAMFYVVLCILKHTSCWPTLPASTGAFSFGYAMRDWNRLVSVQKDSLEKKKTHTHQKCRPRSAKEIILLIVDLLPMRSGV